MSPIRFWGHLVSAEDESWRPIRKSGYWTPDLTPAPPFAQLEALFGPMPLRYKFQCIDYGQVEF
jgi:hypothetical protein